MFSYISNVLICSIVLACVKLVTILLFYIKEKKNLFFLFSLLLHVMSLSPKVVNEPSRL